MGLSLIDVEFPREDIRLKKTRIDGFMVLSAVIDPAEFFLDCFHRLLLVIGEVIEDGNHLDPLDHAVVEKLGQANARKRGTFSGSEASVNGLDVLQVEVAIAPPKGHDRYADHVRSQDDVAYPTLARDAVQGREDCMVSGDLAIRSRGLQERELKILELLPINHVGVQVDVQLLDHILDVCNRQLRVPTIVQMNGEWP